MMDNESHRFLIDSSQLWEMAGFRQEETQENYTKGRWISRVGN